MATYHGITKAVCLVCDWQTTDTPTIERINDLADCCPECENQFFKWENKDGSIVVSLTKEKDGKEIYDNLVLEGNK